MKAAHCKLMILIIISEIQILLLPIQGSSHELSSNETKESSSISAANNQQQQQQSAASHQSSISLAGDISSDAATAAAYLLKDSDTKQDQLVQATSTSVHHHHHHHHPNHQNYPVEPYPSASYTSLTVTAAPQAANPSSNNNNNNNQQHQPSSQFSSQSTSNYNDNASNTFMNSYGNQAEQLERNSANVGANNHNYGISTSSLNTGLIQNLTASLFPIKQLSNATLLTLSELLNKTRQTTSSATTYPHLISNGYKPTFNLAYPAYFSQATQPAGSTNTLASSNYLDSNQITGANDHKQQYSLVDYIRPNQFGFRQASQHYHSPSSSFFRASHLKGGLNYDGANQQQSASEQFFPDNQHSAYKTSSNIYNTYMPYKDNLNSLPTITNGQTLNMALYGYKMPLVLNTVKGYSSDSAQSNKAASGFGSASSGTTMSNLAGSGLQYLQHHNINNQNQLNKLVYSTPFRPSIVSPPPSTVTGTFTTPGYSGVTLASIANGLGSSNQRPKTEADNKSVTFASLGSPSSSISDSNSEYSTNGPSNEAGKYSGKDSARQQQKSADKTSTTTPTTLAGDQFELGRFKPSNLTNQANLFGDKNYTSSRSTSSNSPNNPDLLFDLYEREIDNQIRDALYSESQNPDPLMNIAREAPKPWFDKSASLYEDSSALDQALASWERPIAIPSQHNAYGLQQDPLMRARPLHSGAINLNADPLAEALQDLPTFSSSDLQPIFPNGQAAYSYLPAASQDSFAESQLASLNSQLFHPSQAGSIHHQVSFDGATNKANKLRNLNPIHQASSGSTASSVSAPVSGGLHAILFKLHSSPLSSILSNPLTHLYSNLPTRNKSNKKPSSSQATKQSDGGQLSHLSSLFPYQSQGGATGKHLLNSFATDSSNYADSLTPSASYNIGNKLEATRNQQQAALNAASLLAAAAADNPIGPLLQAQAANNMYLADGSASLDLETALSGFLGRTAPMVAPPGGAYETPEAQLGYGLAGGGISPLIWRSIFSPAHWARKQSTSPSSGQTNPQHQQQATQSSPLHQTFTSPTTPLQLGSQKFSSQQQQQPSSKHLNSLFGMNLFTPAATSSASNQQVAPAKQAQRKPRLKIKILKIPVAFYDNGASSSQASGSTTSSQYQTAASLLASIPCPLNHSGHQTAHSLDRHLIGHNSNSNSASASSTALGSFMPSALQQQTGNNQANNETPISIQAFTDINQPNDLQVSPTTSLQAKLLKMLQ